MKIFCIHMNTLKFDFSIISLNNSTNPWGLNHKPDKYKCKVIFGQVLKYVLLPTEST